MQQDVIHDITSIRAKVTEALTGPSAAFEIEIGCGHGEFAIALAKVFGDRFFFAVDINYGKFTDAVEEKKTIGGSNLAFFHYEGHEFLKHVIPDSSISRVHLYFPTPYVTAALGVPHLLMRKSFVNELARVLVPAGEFRMLTDDRRYYESAISLFDADKWLAAEWTPFPLEMKKGMLVQSGCEVKYRLREQVEIHELTLKSLKDW